MNILMLGWELPPHNSGGLGVASHGIAEGLVKAGHEVSFVVPYQDSHPGSEFMKIVAASPFSAKTLQRYGMAYDSAWFDGLTQYEREDWPKNMDLTAQRQLYTKFVGLYAQKNKHKFDIIHAHEWLTLEAGMIARQALGKPLVAHVHATEFSRSGENLGNPVVHAIEEQGLLMADHVVAVSQHTKNVIVNNYHIPADKVEVIHNAINPEEYTNLGATDQYHYLEQMKERGYKVVVNIGRLTIQKGLNYLLKTFREVKELYPKSLLLIVGDGELYCELIELSAELGIASSVLFAGFQRGQALRQAYAIGDVFVMPSVSEPFGITPLEAASFGTPVVMSKTSGVGEILRSSFKSDYWDTRDMADKIINLLEHEGLHEEMARRAYHEFSGLSWLQVAEKCQSLYDRVLLRHSEAFS